VLAGFAFGVRSAVNRYNVEVANRRVEGDGGLRRTALDGRRPRLPVAEVLSRFKAAGVTSVALSEDTIGGLEDAGRLTVDAGRVRTGEVTALAEDADEGGTLLRRVEEALRAKTRYKVSGVQGGAAPVRATPTIEVTQPWAYVRGVGVGLDPDEVAEVKAAGLGIVGRVSNYNGVNDAGLTWVLHGLKVHGVTNVIFSGDAVLGNKGFIADDRRTRSAARPPPHCRTTASASARWSSASRRATRRSQGGRRPDSARPHDHRRRDAVRDRARQRPAFRARRPRAQHPPAVRPPLHRRDGPVAFNTKYVEKLTKALERGGMTLGTAHGYNPLGVGTVPRR
jgi:hypothetical protein